MALPGSFRPLEVLRGAAGGQAGGGGGEASRSSSLDLAKLQRRPCCPSEYTLGKSTGPCSSRSLTSWDGRLPPLFLSEPLKLQPSSSRGEIQQPPRVCRSRDGIYSSRLIAPVLSMLASRSTLPSRCGQMVSLPCLRAAAPLPEHTVDLKNADLQYPNLVPCVKGSHQQPKQHWSPAFLLCFLSSRRGRSLLRL